MFLSNRPPIKLALKGLGPVSLKKEVLHKAGSNLWGDPRFVLRGFVPFLLQLPVLWLIAKIFGPVYDEFGEANNLVSLILSLCIMMLAFVNMWIQTSLRQRICLAEELIRRNLRPDLCLECGYDLSGTPDESTACPECGAKIAQVTKQEPETESEAGG